MSTKNQITQEQIEEFQRLKAENAALQARLKVAESASRTGQYTLTRRLGQKGGMCVYGFGTRPFTFYAAQALAMFSPSAVRDTLKWVRENAGRMSVKLPKEAYRLGPNGRPTDTLVWPKEKADQYIAAAREGFRETAEANLSTLFPETDATE